MRRILFFLVAVGLIWGAGYLYFQEAAPAKVQYVTSAVSKDTLRESITATGTVNAVVTVEVGSQL